MHIEDVQNMFLKKLDGSAHESSLMQDATHKQTSEVSAGKHVVQSSDLYIQGPTGRAKTMAHENIAPAQMKGAGPLNPKARIAIIGAGPSGITAAAELKAQGYENVVVLERDNRVGGRCETTEHGSDMGAVAHVPIYYGDVMNLTDELGIERTWAPVLEQYEAATGEISPSMTIADGLKLAAETVRYMFKHKFSWKGVSGARMVKTSPELHIPWADFTKQQNLEHFGRAADVVTKGFGYRSEAAALYNTRYLPPEAVLGGQMPGTTGLGYWKGGSQQIWEKLSAEHNVEVQTGVTINKIDRSNPHGDVPVKIFTQNQNGKNTEQNFDRLIIACNPTHLLPALDATPEETRLYSKIKTFDYRTYEIRVDDFKVGESAYGAFRDSLDREDLDRPLIFFKRDPEKNIFVVYVNGSGADDTKVFENIKTDMARLGGSNIELLTARHWDFLPHVGKDALDDGHYGRLEALQGSNNTMLTGAACTHDTLPHVTRHARSVVKTLIQNGQVEKRVELPALLSMFARLSIAAAS